MLVLSLHTNKVPVCCELVLLTILRVFIKLVFWEGLLVVSQYRIAYCNQIVRDVTEHCCVCDTFDVWALYVYTLSCPNAHQSHPHMCYHQPVDKLPIITRNRYPPQFGKHKQLVATEYQFMQAQLYRVYRVLELCAEIPKRPITYAENCNLFR
jgi:hypothetical protein